MQHEGSGPRTDKPGREPTRDGRASLVVPPRPGVDLSALEARDTIPPNSASRLDGTDDPTAARGRATMALPARRANRLLPRFDIPEDAFRPTPPTDTIPLRFRETHHPAGDTATAEERQAGASLRTCQEGARELLTLAAVIGEQFWYGCLRALYIAERWKPGRSWALPDIDDDLNTRLVELQQRGFIETHESSSHAGDTEFTFVNRSTRQLLLRNLPAERAARLHRAAGRWMGELPPAERESWSELRARHLDAGGLPREAAEDYWLAARRRVSAGQLPEAAALLERAANIVELDHAPELARVQGERLELLTRLGWYEDADRAAAIALHGAHVLGRRETAAVILLRRARLALMAESAHEALGRLEAIQGLFDAERDQVSAGMYLAAQAEALLLQGRTEAVPTALRLLDSALHPARPLDAEALTRLRLATLPVAAEARLMSGDGAMVESALRDLRHAADWDHDPSAAVAAGRVLGDLHWARGSEGSAIEAWERALDESTRMELRGERTRLAVRLAEAALARGQRRASEEHAQAAVRDAELLGSPFLLSKAYRAVARTSDNPDELLRSAGEYARQHGALNELAAVDLVRAELVLATPDGDQRVALASLERARAQFESCGNQTALGRTLLRIANLASTDDAESLRRRARTFLARL